MSVPLSALRPLMGRLSDLKRVRTADVYNRTSLTQSGFARSWGRLINGAPALEVAARECAYSLADIQLCGTRPVTLIRAGLSIERATEIFVRAIVRSGEHLSPAMQEWLVQGFASPCDGQEESESAASFVWALARQPRAGATHPTKQRIILEPAESHADHCYGVAVLGALLTAHYGGDPAVPFLAGLAHHLHNAALPDGGFAAEELLGDDYPKIVEKLTADALAELPAALAEQVRDALNRCLPYPDAPEAKCFHAADVIDRVLEAVHFDRVARFRLSTAVDELELVHPGPFRAFQNETLLAAGVLG